MLGMCTCGGMVGWKGVMPKSSHHRGLARCQEKGEKEWSAGAPAARLRRHTMSQWGGGVVYRRLVVGYTWTWASLGFPTGLVRMELRSWSGVAGLGGQMQKFKGGELAAEFPPQSCGPGLPPKVGVVGGAA